MNILHVVNIYFVLPYFIGDQFLYFKSKGYDLHVICSPSEHLKEYSGKMKFKYQEIQISRAIKLVEDLKALFKICRYIRKNKIEIVVGHTPKGALLSMIAAYIMRVPKRIYFRHGLVYETSKGIKRSLLKNLDRITSFCSTKIVCVSSSVYKMSLKHKLNREDKQLILGKGTCTGIDISKTFNPEILVETKIKSLKTKLGIPEKAFVIGYCGRLVRDKGIIELVEAFNLIRRKYPDMQFILLLVGMFEERDALPDNIITEIIEDKGIIYTGFINESIEYYYSLMNIYVLASYREGFPTSVLEASAMKIPVVTTSVTGCIDSVIEDITGKFVENTSESVAKGIEFYIQNEFLAKKHGEGGREFVSKYFDQEIVWKEIENLYET